MIVESKNDLADLHLGKKVVCITGANGFIGRKIVEYVNKQCGRIKVLTRKKDLKFPGNVEIFVDDLTDSNCDLEEFLKDADILIHCRQTKIENEMSALHIDGTRALIASVKKEISRSQKISIGFNSVLVVHTDLHRKVTSKISEK